MHNKKRLPHLLLALALGATAAEAMALGFGAAAPTATLGHTLDHRIDLRLDAGETLAPECVSAEVTVGEQRLPAAAVRTRLEGTGSQLRLRVLTSVAIDEPVLALTVAVGCPMQLSRRFVLFADPAPAAAPSAPLTPLAESVAPPPPAVPAPVPVAPPAEPRPAAAVRPAPVATAAAEPPPQRPAPVRRRAVAEAPSAAAPARAPRPRLRLDAAEPPAPLITAEMVQAAASEAAAQAASAAASAAAARIATLEADMARLRAESAADREALLALRQRAANADAQAQWMPWLLALAAALALLSGWQALKLRRLNQERQLAWWNAASAGTAPPAPEAAPAPAAEAPQPTTVSPSGGGYSTTRPGTLGPVFTPDPALAAAGGAEESAVERTQALPVGWREESAQSRDVSIEELIDLEQQAEFFIVLGQEDAAVDLLVDHLRSTGGGSPMPYLKLLEIYRRRGDREAYDRTRARFNHRFNAYAPDWDDDPSQGRSLEDYPAIVARLQQAWPSPIDAMAELESLLFRKARGELFDLPAYRDVMFLYSLARDLLDREPLESGHVDVLLPISDGADRTQPMSLAELPAGESAMVPLDQPTVPVDLDVTQPNMPESLFGENDPANRRRRRGPGA